jgi:hypothetical protein
MIEKLRQLSDFSAERQQIVELKKIAINDQKYEKAAELRNEERNIEAKIEELRNEERNIEAKIEDILELDTYDFETPELTSMIRKDLFEVIKYIDEDDSSLTPALIRKLATELQEVKQEQYDISWKSMTAPRPELIEEFEYNGATCMSSNDLVIMYETKAGSYDICFGRYVQERIGVHDVRYYFVVKGPEGELVNLDKIRGWKNVEPETIKWIMINENDKRKKGGA